MRGAAGGRSRHESDFYAWTQRQAEALRRLAGGRNDAPRGGDDADEDFWTKEDPD